MWWADIEGMETPQTTFYDREGLPEHTKLPDGTYLSPEPSQAGEGIRGFSKELNAWYTGVVVWDGASDVEQARKERRRAKEAWSGKTLKAAEARNRQAREPKTEGTGEDS